MVQDPFAPPRLQGLLTIDYRQKGASGLKQYAGLIHDDPQPELNGVNGLRVFRKMYDQDSLLGGIMNAILILVRQMDWRVKAASGDVGDQARADFVDGCMNDMEQPFREYMAEAMLMCVYGFSTHELVYKRRGGDSLAPWLQSRYSDGRTGWRGLPVCGQETITRWFFDTNGRVQAFEQVAPPHYRPVVIPMEKVLLFRTTASRGNPTGRSIYRSCYADWYIRSGLKNVEAVGIERDVAGIPTAYVPPEVMAAGTSGTGNPLDIQTYQSIEQMVTNLRNDEQASVIMPSAFDDRGNKLYDLQLMNSGGSKQFDVDKVIQRYDHRMAMTMLADFMLMGQSSSSTGSFAMHTDKKSLFAMSLSAYLDVITDELNNKAIPRLMALNGWGGLDYPKVEHGDVESADLAKLGAYIQALATSGMPLFPNPDLEKYLCQVAGIPLPAASELPGAQAAPLPPRPGAVPSGPPRELHDEASTDDAPQPGTEPHPDDQKPQAMQQQRLPLVPRQKAR